MKTLDGTFGALLGAVALMCIPTTHAGGWETELPQPEMRQSSDGVLDTVLRAHIAANEMTDQLTGKFSGFNADLFWNNSRADLGAEPRRYAEDQPRQQLAARTGRPARWSLSP